MIHFTQRRALEAAKVLLMIQCTQRRDKEPRTALLIFSEPAKAPSAPAAAPVYPGAGRVEDSLRNVAGEVDGWRGWMNCFTFLGGRVES